jgi:hypothetical protein
MNRALLLVPIAAALAGCGSTSNAATPHAASPERLAHCVTAATDGDSAVWRSGPPPVVFADWYMGAAKGDHLVARLSGGHWRPAWKPASAAKRHGAVFARCAR